jgi:hypothetical protein
MLAKHESFFISRPLMKLGSMHSGLGTKELRSQRSEIRRQMTEGRWFKVLNIEQQNKKPQNDEVITSIFPPAADSTFCGSKRR